MALYIRDVMNENHLSYPRGKWYEINTMRVKIMNIKLCILRDSKNLEQMKDNQLERKRSAYLTIYKMTKKTVDKNMWKKFAVSLGIKKINSIKARR